MTYLVKIIINGVKITDIEYSKENEWKQNNGKIGFQALSQPSLTGDTDHWFIQDYLFRTFQVSLKISQARKK